VVAGPRIYLLRPGFGAGPHGHLAYHTNWWDACTDDQSRCGRELSGFPGCANALVSRYRSRRLGSVDLQYGHRAAGPAAGHIWHRQIHLTCCKRRWTSPGGDSGKSKGHSLAGADRERAGGRSGRSSYSADDWQRLVASNRTRVPALRLVEGHHRQHLETAGRQNERIMELARDARHRRARHCAERTAHCVFYAAS
jgi:hypothetical protein